MRKYLLAFAAVAGLLSNPAEAQSWTTTEQTPSWVASPVVGDGVDRSAEVSTTAQGGDPPALTSEPADINEGTVYTRTAWLTTPSLPGDRFDNGEGKFRTTCNWSHFGTFDPIVYHGTATAGHHHTFIGNKGTNQSSTYATNRNVPASSCAGGPLNGTAYWEASLMYEISTGVAVPIKPNVITFYYRTSYANAPSLYRLLNGFAFIGGVDPSDRLNVNGLAEIPNGAGWEKTNHRYNGWVGWACFNGATLISPAAGNTADPNPVNAGYLRQLVNADGSDPWNGACENPSYKLIADLNAPGCWDGKNLTSPTGRRHVRYAIYQGSDQAPDDYKCPNGWWQVPTLEAKPEFPNGRPGISGHAWRSKLYLSSDRMDPNPANWQPRGSTMHFDWMNGWDRVIMNTWLIHCVGVAINGTAGDPLTCNDSTISSTQKMFTLQTPPDPTLANSPIITFHDYSTGASKDAFGPMPTGTVVSGTITHHH